MKDIMNTIPDITDMRDSLKQEDVTRKQIINDFSHNILVEAGAGSGKTTIMVERILNQVITLGTELERIVAITFTEKAANELKERFQIKLLERYATEKKRTGEASLVICSRLKKAIDNIDKIHISTIHSFCSRMLREMPFEAGLGMEITIVQDADERKMKKKLFSEFCENDMSGIDPLIEQLKGELRNVNINPEGLARTFEDICDKRDVEWSYNKNSTVNYSSLYAKADRYVKRIVEILKAQPGTATGFTEDQLKSGGRCIASDYSVIKEATSSLYRMSQAPGIIALDPLIRALSDLDKNPCAARKDAKKNYNEKMLEIGKKVNDSFEADQLCIKIAGLKEEYKTYRHSLAMSYLEFAINYYQSVKHKEKKLTNEDLLIYARNMIRDSQIARAFFQRKFETFYVDEFQDTNPIQTELLFYLSCTQGALEAGSFPKDWLKCKLESGRLFMVGDPKQSIYSFTGADITLYNKVRDKLNGEDNGIIYQLKANYRSNRSICSWIQSTFIKGSSSYGFPGIDNPLEAGQAVFEGMITPAPEEKPSQNMLKGVYRYDLGTATKDEMIARDAAYIPELILKAIESKTLISLYNAKEQQSLIRPVNYGDFLIITWNTTSMSAYIEALKARGIPISVSGKIETESLEEVHNLVLLLRYLEDYNSSYLLATVLERLFGCHYEADEKFGYTSIVWNEAKINELEDERLKRALSKLHQLLKLKIFEPPMVLVENIVNDFKLITGNKRYDYITLSGAMGNVEQMLEIIRSEQYSNLSDITLRLEALSGEKLDREMSITDLVDEAGEYNAVRIMNLHKAKGLEGNIVILADPATKANAKDDRIIYTEENGQKKGYVKIVSDKNETYGQPDGWSNVTGTNNSLKEQELLRLNYVACTRAKEALIVSSGQVVDSRNSIVKETSWADFVNYILIDDEMKQACGGVFNYSEVMEKNTKDENSKDVNTKDENSKDENTKEADATSAETTNAATSDADTGTACSEDWRIVDTGESFSNLQQENRSKIDSAKQPISNTIHPSSQFNYVARSKEQSSTSRFRGNLYGIIVHKLFQLLVEERDGDPILRIKRSIHAGLDSERLTKRQCRTLNLDEAVIWASLPIQKQTLFEALHDNLQEITNKFLNDRAMQERIQTADAVYTELPFQLRIEPSIAKAAAEAANLKTWKEGNHIYVSGIMDLVLVKGNHYTIIDYKTNAKGDDEEIATFKKDLYTHYQPQLDLYENAIKTIVGEAVTVEKRLYTLYE